MEKNLSEIFYFFIKNRFKIFPALLLIFVLSFFVYKKLSLKKRSLEYYFNTEKTYKEWRKNPSKNLFNELNKFLEKDPSLALKYEGAITQDLLYNGDKQAFKRGLKSLRNKKEADHYYDFAKISLFSEKNLKKALFSSINLNLLRISFLQKKLGDKKAELCSLKEIEDYIIKSKETKTRLFLKNFQKDEMSLQDYIAYRKKKITK